MNALARAALSLLRPWPSLVAWAVLVFVGSSIPLPVTPEVDFPISPDKIVHALAYAVLAGLAVRATSRSGRRRALAVAVVVAAVAYGALLEGWQALLAARTTELGDAVANASGAAVGGLAALAACRAPRRGRANVMEPPDHGETGRSQED